MGKVSFSSALRLISIVCVVVGFVLTSTATNVTISNVDHRVDTFGNILESGDGSLHKFGNTWYLYGTLYLPCPLVDQACCYEWCGPVWMCGWRNMTFSVYSSPDLVKWTLETTNALPQALTHPTITTHQVAFFEPAVIYNPTTNKYVMWWVIQKHGGDGGMGVATSDSPVGPFVYAWDLTHPEINQGRVPGWTQNADLYLWYSPTLRKAFMKHNGQPTNASQDPPANYVSELSVDFLTFVATSEPIEPGIYEEGGGIFERNGSWYVTFGQGCCFCNKGGSTRVHRSQNPLGPYTYVGDINLARNQSFGLTRTQTSTSLMPRFHPEPESPTSSYCGARGGRGCGGVPPPLHDQPTLSPFNIHRTYTTLVHASPTQTLYGYYSSQHTDNAVMATKASEAWATANTYTRWSMFDGGVAGAGAAASAGGGVPAGPGRWSELVSYYSPTLDDWLLVSSTNPNASKWIETHAYVKQRSEAVYVVANATSVVGYSQPLTQHWKASINDTAIAGSAAVVAELERQGYVQLWLEGYGVGSASPPPPPPHPTPPPTPTPKKYVCFGSGLGVCAESKAPSANYNDSTCDSKCPRVPPTPRQPSAYEIPAQQFGFTMIPSVDGKGEPSIMYIGLRFGSAPTKNHDFQYWEVLRFDEETGNILPLKWADNFTLIV